MKQQRDYQIKGVDALAGKVRMGIKRLIYQLSTGGGKTVMFAGLTKRFMDAQPGKILILVHREELLQQAYKTLFHWYEITAIPVTAGSGYFPNARVNIAMVETANNRLKKNPNYFGNVGLVIIDEAHRGEFKKMHPYFPDAIVIGFTATPLSGDKKDPLKNNFDDIVCGIDIPQLIEIWKEDHTQGLVPNHTIVVSSVNRKSLKSDSRDFVEREMAEEYSKSKHVENCIAAYKNYSEGKKAVIFNCNIEHSKKVTAAFQAFGYPTRHLDGKTPTDERKSILRWFKETPGAILNNVDVATTGFDEPSIETVIHNYSTQSLVKWLQTSGRGSRPYPGKELWLNIDLGGNGPEHGDWADPRDWKDIFFNPPKLGAGGEAPSKECKGCHALIHASTIICPHCGAENKKKALHDADTVSFSSYGGRKLPDIYVEDLIRQNLDKKPLYVLFKIRNTIVGHVKHRWRIKTLTDEMAADIISHYTLVVNEWCEIGKEKFGRFEGKNGDQFIREVAWHQRMATKWMEEDLKKYFNWERSMQKIA